MNRRDFLRMIFWAPLLKFPNFLSRASKFVHYGTDSVLDEVDFPYVATGPHRDTMDLIAPERDATWGYTWVGDGLFWMSLRVEPFPTGDELFINYPLGTVDEGKIPSDATVSWWLGPCTVYDEGHVLLVEVPDDGRMHCVAVTREEGNWTKAYLDGDLVYTKLKEVKNA